MDMETVDFNSHRHDRHGTGVNDDFTLNGPQSRYVVFTAFDVEPQGTQKRFTHGSFIDSHTV